MPSLITSLRYRKQNQYRSDTSRKASSTIIAYIEWADLLDYLQSTNAPLREGAAFRLHEMFRVTPKLIGESTNQAIIARCLSDPDPNVRLLATECLAFASPPPGDALLPVIQQLCHDPDYAIRLRAVELLRNIGRDHPASQELLENVSKNDPAPVVRVWAAEAANE
jgi:HEAT repeat protein